MSQFTRNCRVEVVGKNLFKVIEPFEYHVGFLHSNEVITVPYGFLTDFASVPRIFWSIISPIDTHANAAVIHDFMYKTRYAKKSRCEEIFYEALGVLNVPEWKRRCMYYSVYYFGWKAWIQCRLQDKEVSCYDNH